MATLHLETLNRIVDTFNTWFWVPVTLIEGPIAYRRVKRIVKHYIQKRREQRENN